MDLPVPTHLQKYLTPVGNKNSEYEVKGKIHCACGNESFKIFESNDRQIIKLLCRQCGREILLFDAGKHGWEGFVCNDDFLDRTLPFEKYICSKCGEASFGVTVHILSQGKEDFSEECDDDSFSPEDWVNAFEWITVSLLCSECKFSEKEWLDFETM